MIRNKLFGCLLLAGCASLAQAEDGLLPTLPSVETSNQLNGTQLYVGGSLGMAQQGDSCNDPFFNGGCDDKDVAWKAFGGARFNPMLGVEAAYNHMGSSKAEGAAGGTPAQMENSLTGVSLSAVGYVPLNTDQLEAFGKAGAMFWKRESSQTINNSTQSSTDDGTSPLIGAGAQYRLNENLRVRGEWEHVFNMGSDSVFETDADLYTVGLLYSTL